MVGGVTLVRSRYSVGAWSLPPTGPKPSIVGMPRELVVLASAAPPVAHAAVLMPRSAASFNAAGAGNRRVSTTVAPGGRRLAL